MSVGVRHRFLKTIDCLWGKNHKAVKTFGLENMLRRLHVGRASLRFRTIIIDENNPKEKMRKALLLGFSVSDFLIAV